MLYPNHYPSHEFLTMRNELFSRKDALLPQNVLNKFYDTLILHITCVQEAGAKLGVPQVQLEIHDLSKFGRDEFNAYAMHFQGGGAPDAFAAAWLHHLHANPHHWQHWMFADGFTPKGSQVENGSLEMPEHYALEMIADWMGASKAYTGSDDMGDWLSTNLPKISVHSKTAIFLRSRLTNLGYADVVHLYPFKSEVIRASHDL